MASGVVETVGSSNYAITTTLGWNPGFSWEGREAGYDPAFNTIYVSREYADAIGMEFTEGENFSSERSSGYNAVLINESALALMQLNNPVGQKLHYDREWITNKNFEISGVVKDMVKGSPFEFTYPSIMFLSEDPMSNLFIRISEDADTRDALTKINQVFEEVIPTAAFDYKFADVEYARKFKSEERIGSLARYFALLTIFISCLGLFGLSSFITERRTKEIGIRKVLGASIMTLLRTMSSSYVILILISTAVSIPLSQYVMKGWLSGYAIQTDLSWWVYAMAGFGALFITLFTVSFQALRTATRNPVDSLRYE